VIVEAAAELPPPEDVFALMRLLSVYVLLLFMADHAHRIRGQRVGA